MNTLFQLILALQMVVKNQPINQSYSIAIPTLYISHPEIQGFIPQVIPQGPVIVSSSTDWKMYGIYLCEAPDDDGAIDAPPIPSAFALGENCITPHL